MEYTAQKEYVVGYVKQLAAANLLGENDSVSLRLDSSYLITKEGKATAEITPEDIEEIKFSVTPSNLHEAIYLSRIEINAVITNHAKNCVTVAATGKAIPAVLDDLAQIIGHSVRVAKNADYYSVLKTLKGRNACLIKGGGVVATGRTLDEAYTGCLVLEKGAKTFIETTALGGSVLVPTLDALLQRFVYKTKYSKKDQASKL